MADIYLNHIIPEPLKDREDLKESEVWNAKLVLNSGNNYLIEAPSGRGKSTFLNILYGVRGDYKGEWSLGKTNTKSFVEKDWNNLRRNEISMVFQGLELFDHLTVLENIQLRNELTQHKSESEISEMLDRLGVLTLKDKKCEKISFGQRQRVAAIRALCGPFNWLLLDEPFSHLDKVNGNSLLNLISEECKNKKAGLILTSLGIMDTNLDAHQLVL